MIRYKIALTCFFSMFLVLSSSMTFQSTLAPSPPPTVTFTSASYPGGSFLNGDRIPMTQRQTSMTVTINFQGTDTNDYMRSLECRWSGGNMATPTSLASNNCDRYLMVNGRTATSRVEKDVVVSPNPYVLEVRGVDTNGMTGSLYRFTFTVTQAQAPTISFTRVEDGYGVQVSSSRPTTSQELAITMQASGQGLSRLCATGVSQGTLPAGIRYDSSLFSSCRSITPSTNQIPHQTLGVGVIMGTGQKWYCAVVFDRTNLPSIPACASWQVVTNSGSQPPNIEITLHSAHTGSTRTGHTLSDYSNVRNGGTTTYDNIHFRFLAVPNGMSIDANRRALFDCAWDTRDWEPCGRITVPLAYSSPTGGIIGPITVHENLKDEVAYPVSDGEHTLAVKSRWADSRPGPTAVFIWCVSRTNACIPHPSTYSEIIPTSISQGNMISGTNETATLQGLKEFNKNLVFIAEAGPANLTVIEGNAVALNGSVIIVSPKEIINKVRPFNASISENIYNTSGALESEGKKYQKQFIDQPKESNVTISSVNWSQLSGPDVKLNISANDAPTSENAVQFNNRSVGSSTIQTCIGCLARFIAPSVEQNTPLSFRLTFTDDNGKQYSDTINILVVNAESIVPGDVTKNITHQETGKVIEGHDPLTRPDISTGQQGTEEGSAVKGGELGGTGKQEHGVDDSNVQQDKSSQKEEEEAPAGGGAADESSASKIEQNKPSLEDDKPNCRVGETFTEEGCAPS